MPILAGSVEWTDAEVIAVWGALRAMLSWVPDIEPKRKPLEAAFRKLNDSLADENRPAIAALTPSTE